MVITGQFRDLKNNLISVEIYNPNQSGNYITGDVLDNEHHFCFDGKAPVKISRKCGDLFEPIISASCKIRLRSNIWCGDKLFANGVGDIIVKVERQTHNQQTGQDSLTKDLLFIGYVKPLSFNQNINQATNIIDINCVDLLGFLKDKYLSTGLSNSQSDSAWEEALANAQYRSFLDIFKKIGLYNTEFPFPSTAEYTNLFVDASNTIYIEGVGTVPAVNNITLSDNLWLGESVSDEMSLYDIMLELLKYINCRIVSTNGRDFFIISNMNTSSTLSFYVNDDYSQTTDFDDTTGLPKTDIANEQVSMDECYNLISVKCELESLDDVVSDPLEANSFLSSFSNKQWIMREFVCDDTDGGRGAAGEITWKNMIFSGELPEEIPSGITEAAQKAYASLWIKDHYIRVLENPSWTLNNSYTPSKLDGKNIKQYESLINMNNLYYQATSYDQYSIYDNLPSSATFDFNPFFISYGSDKDKRTINNPAPSAQISTKNILVIPCPETWLYGYNSGTTQITEQQAYNFIDAQLAKYENNPIIKYNSSSSVNLTPSDNSITNYIVFSGKIKLVPSFRGIQGTVPSDNLTYRGTSTDWSKQKIAYQNLFGNRDWQPAIGTDKDKTRWYYQQFYTRTNPSNGNVYPTHDVNEGNLDGLAWNGHPWSYWLPVDPDAQTVRNGRLFYIDIEDAYGKQFGWGKTKTTKTDTSIITQGFASILLCRLRIGNKYLNEIITDNSKSQQFEWTSDPNATFTLAIQPHQPDDGEEPKDYLIGQEYSIINNVTSDMNISLEGTAIPITYDDKLSGDLEFSIISPFNATVNTVNHYYKHGTWFRNAQTFDSSTDICLLNHVHSINISEFSVKVDTDNAKNATLNSGDLLYYSEDNKKYNNEKDDIEFKIVTALTGEESAELNIATGISFNNPTRNNGNLFTTSYANRPEKRYIDTMYSLYSEPKKIIEYKCNFGDNKIDEIYRSVYQCDLMSHLGVNAFSSFVLGDDIDLKNNRIKITLREI